MKIELTDEELDFVDSIMREVMNHLYLKLEDLLEDIPFSRFMELRGKLMTRKWCESSGIRYEDMTQDDWYNFIEWDNRKRKEENK